VTHKTADDSGFREDRDTILSLVETSLADWRRAGADQKDSLLLSGAALVWAERWLLTRPDEVNGVMKAYIQRSIATRVKKSTDEEQVRRSEIERKERTYNRILIVASLMALAFLGPKTLREAGFFDKRETAAAKTEVAVAAPVTAAGGEPHQAVLSSRAGQHHVEVAEAGSYDSVGDGSVIGAERGGSASQALVKLAAAYGQRGDRRTGYLLAAEYVQSAIEPRVPVAAEVVETKPKRTRRHNPEAQQWSALPTDLSDAMNALAVRTALALAPADRLAHNRPLVGCGGGRMLAVSERGSIAVWTASQGRQDNGIRARSRVSSPKAIDRSCSMFAGTTDDYKVTLTTLRGGERRIVGRHDADVFGFSFDAAGARLATVARDGVVKVWDAATGAVLLTVRSIDEDLGGVRLSSDGTRLLVWSDGRAVTVRDVATGAVLGTLVGHASTLVDAEFSDDGAHILTISVDGTGMLWSGKTYAPLVHYLPRVGSVVQVRLSDDLTRAAVVTDEGDVAIWDNRRGAHVRMLSIAHQIMVDAVFNADGSLVATVDEAGHIGIWETDGGGLRLGLSTGGEGIAALSFSADSATLSATALDGTITEWPLMLSTEAALTLVRRHADACLSQIERARLRLPGRAPEWCKALDSR